MVTRDRLTIAGYNGRPLKNSFFRQSDSINKLGIVFPGLAYGPQMPLLHYTITTMIESGLNVLAVDYDYSNNPEFMKESQELRSDWFMADIEAVVRVATTEENQEVVCLAGKSLGTLAVGHLLETQEDLRDVKTIWLTPLLKNPQLLEQMLAYIEEAVMVIGAKDQHYDSNIIDRLNAKTRLSGIVIERADHSLEIEGDTTQTLQVLMQIVTIIQQFLA
ncbi:MAG: alpha/beta family hydrolase [Candidatus Thorarchaeota archaeon]